ncbi:serine--tRNA ligase [Candidatus Collierbacteria bacterium CG_4_10_14_0_8_um_filter_43_86]|uniref:Serine--tRNA ligase n=2 Tax=Candidatus Collieribacteriota TaxID=1752725 RepID=A0A2H0DTP5_9BACT|nr:MAG: serine--tRNA ligase [Candidatus Collierbacteria bacterium CG22_combo_CG10-13_8_21_14_all_43_12]PIZ24737.1 MAG: serine--tRNA ligase [Candidatus Collierbacteria bacterium CG_4_10_14_0_8_um_filter_43_86]PJB47053.1 MAG: serine--tRNA ligase [Candidatus Collierbacteria bacterium CG_4_9_14_3_um_filter_43_16]
MLDINYIRDNKDALKKAIANKQFDPTLVDKLVGVDNERRKLIQEVEELRRQGNANIADIKGKPSDEQIANGKEIKQKIQETEPRLTEVEKQYLELMFQIPNPSADDVPVGKDESGNVEIKTWGNIPKFDYPILPHEELAEGLDLLDNKRAVRIAGSRAFFTKNDLVLLEYGLLMYALKMMIGEGYTPMTVPWMVNDEAMLGTGYFPWGMEDHYKTQDGQSLIGTAEVSLTAFYKDEILNENDLPVKMVGISPCYRREIGSYGKDTKGIFRVHQFNKVEQVVYTVADEVETRKMHDQMLDHTEKLLQALGLPYHVLLMCTGDMGAGQRRKYDVEVWFPSQNAYRETHSDSYFNDFQSRRLNIRYRAKDGTQKFVYTLNNTVVATPRILGAILENYQQADGSVKVPEILVPFVGKGVIKHV